MKRFIGANEISTHLGIPVDFVYKLAREHKIPYTKIGTRLLFDPDRIDRWLEQQSHEPISA